MSDYLRALKERRKTLKSQREAHARQLEELEQRAASIVEQARADAERERDEILAAAKGEDGDLGPMPRHQWKGTRLRFEDGERGSWGKYVDLQGRPGPPGPRGAPGKDGAGSGADLATLDMLASDVAETDTMIIERAGELFRVSVSDLQSVLGGSTVPADTVYAGDEPILAGSEYVIARDE